MTEPATIDEDDPLASFLAFANEVLGFGETFIDPSTGRKGIYEWQEDAVTPFDEASERLVQVTLATPNGSGKSAVVIPTLGLGWLAFYPKGRVVITTAGGKQLDGQVMPAIEAHRSKFPTWKFIEREIQTPTGGRLVAFTTDEPGRAEGWHKLNDEEGPLLIIADEAKTISEDIFTAIDRCTYNAILLTSSPGYMHGRFWESQTKPELGFVRLKAGLAQCPHIGQDKIDRIIAKHGPRSPFTLSTLHGEFMLDGAESRFDFEGLEQMQLIAENTHANAARGIISEHGGTFTFQPSDTGWAWIAEHPIEGRAYLAFADPMKGEQSAGSAKRDTHACGILRQDFLDTNKTPWPEELAAAIYVEDKDAFSGAACRWELSVLAHRLWLLAGYYGGCTIVPEENNYGGVLIKELLDLNADVWQREKESHERSGRTVKAYGYQTNTKTKRYWVECLAKAIFEQSFICRFKPAVAQFAAFIQNEDGTCEARPGAFDDFVAGIAIGLTVAAYKTFYHRGNGGSGRGSSYWRPRGGSQTTLNRAVS